MESKSVCFNELSMYIKDENKNRFYW